MQLDPLLAFYSTPLIIIWLVYYTARLRRERQSNAVHEAEAQLFGKD